ncbi:MAG: ASCH domain-containing protein [Chloroflexota bacterium]
MAASRAVTEVSAPSGPNGGALPIAEFGFAGTDLRRRLVAAILAGAKTATSSLLMEYEEDGDPIPSAGERSTLVDFNDQPVGILETTEVRIVPMADVDLDFAIDEGEDFTSVAQWRAAHEAFWSSYRPGPCTDTTLIVCERFRLVELVDPAVR